MSYIAPELRQLVYTRAKGCCEYCRMPEKYRGKRYEVDHIIAEKHRGKTVDTNLCLSCYFCNRYKGSDLSSIDPLTDEVVRLFHPRRDSWADHFALEGALIKPKTAPGRTTVLLLHFNDMERLIERERLILLGVYPLPS